jgi:hypothetical protein
MLGLGFKNRLTFGYESTTEQGMPSWFATTQEKQNYVRNMDLDTYYNLSHHVLLSFTFNSTQGYPLRFLAPA